MNTVERPADAALVQNVRRRLSRMRDRALEVVSRPRWGTGKHADTSALDYQRAILPGVSRTFALTIPQLPHPLADVVANAYLLCRIADTIEDEPRLSPERKRQFQQRFGAVVGGRAPAEDFATALSAELSELTPAAERELVRNTPTILRVTRRFGAAQRGALERCVETMCRGMHDFESQAGKHGLADVAELDRYCYYVAGVVGEMLTELFCAHAPAVARRRSDLMRLAVSFGQALQMTNIIKDVWDDHQRGICWFPRAVFEKHGFDLSQLSETRHGAGFQAGVRELVGVAHGHLRDALAYVLLIPPQERGIRLFCAWAIGMAAQTLDRINAHPDFTSGAEVKISHRDVAWTTLLTRAAVHSDRTLTMLFNRATARLPAAPQVAIPVPAARGPLPEAEPEMDPAARRQHKAGVNAAIARARDALLRLQKDDGHWCFELEADCTIPAEYILMMHFMDEIDVALEQRIAKYLRAHQVLGDHGGWPQYSRSAIDLSCTVKCYYALKLVGDDPDAPHMRRAREAVLALGGAARANVFTKIMLAQFAQIPWRGVPFVPAEIMLLPKWFVFHLDKVSYWARTVMVPLFILISRRTQARNPRGVNVRELFVTPPEEERNYLPAHDWLSRTFLVADRAGRIVEPFLARLLRERAIRMAEKWFVPRLNGEDGLGAIFPAMVNAYEALAELGYPQDHPLRVTALKSIQKLLVERPDGSVYCQPCVSPVWDTGWAALALMNSSASGKTDAVARRAIDRALAWLAPLQETELKGDWAIRAPNLAPGGWAFQYRNAYYPDLDDTAMVAGLLHVAGKGRYTERTERAANWLAGMQSSNGAFGAFDVDNDFLYLNKIPFADHGALCDPPTEDVSGRVLLALGMLGRSQDRDVIRRCVAYIKETQQPDGSWWGRWGTNFIYGTWSVLAGLAFAGEDPRQPYMRRAIAWLVSRQNPDGGWGETNDTYLDPGLAGTMDGESTGYSTAWALLGLMAAGEAHSAAVRRGIDWLVKAQGDDAFWSHDTYTAPGFPRVFYLKYHGYAAYFPLWALVRYRALTQRTGGGTRRPRSTQPGA